MMPWISPPAVCPATVSPEDDIEHRRITLSNFTGKTRTIELTSYAEVVPAAPAAMETDGPLGATRGPVLDPIVSIRCRLTLTAGESVTVGFISGIAGTRRHAEALIDKYRDPQLADRVFGLAVDLIIWNEERTGYRQIFNDRIVGLIAAGPEVDPGACWSCSIKAFLGKVNILHFIPSGGGVGLILLL